MIILRLIVIAFLIVTVIAVGAEAVDFYRSGRWDAISAGQLWMNLHAASREQAQIFVQRSLGSGWWDAMAWILRRPAWAVAGTAAGMLGLVLLWLDVSLGGSLPRASGRRRFRTG